MIWMPASPRGGAGDMEMREKLLQGLRRNIGHRFVLIYPSISNVCVLFSSMRMGNSTSEPDVRRGYDFELDREKSSPIISIGRQHFSSISPSVKLRVTLPGTSGFVG